MPNSKLSVYGRGGRLQDPKAERSLKWPEFGGQNKGAQSHLRASIKRSKAFAQSVSKRAQSCEDIQSKVMSAAMVVVAFCALLLTVVLRSNSGCSKFSVF